MGRTGEVAFFRCCEDLPLSLGNHSTRRTGSPCPCARCWRSSIGSELGTPCFGPRGGWWTFTSGTKKIFQTRIERRGWEVEGGASREDVERPCFALLPREGNSGGEWNEILWEYELIQVSTLCKWVSHVIRWYKIERTRNICALNDTFFKTCYLICDDTAAPVAAPVVYAIKQSWGSFQSMGEMLSLEIIASLTPMLCSYKFNVFFSKRKTILLILFLWDYRACTQINNHHHLSTSSFYNSFERPFWILVA